MCKGMYMINKDLRRQNQGFFSQLYYACQLSSGTYYMGVTNSGNLKIQRMHDSTMQVYQNKTLAKGLKKILQELDENTRKSLLCNEPGTPVQEQYVANFNMKTLEDKLGKALSESFVGKDSLFTVVICETKKKYCIRVKPLNLSTLSVGKKLCNEDFTSIYNVLYKQLHAYVEKGLKQLDDEARRNAVSGYRIRIHRRLRERLLGAEIISGYYITDMTPSLDTITISNKKKSLICERAKASLTADKLVLSKLPNASLLSPEYTAHLKGTTEGAWILEQYDQLIKELAEAEYTIKDKNRSKIVRQMEEEICAFQSWNKEIWLKGKKQNLQRTCNISFSLKDETTVYKNGTGTIRESKDGTITRKYSPVYKKYHDLTDHKLYMRCMDYALEQFKDYDFAIVQSKEAPGILNGTTSFTIRKGEYSISYQYITQPWDASVTEWKSNLLKNKREIDRLLQEQEKKKDEKIKSKLSGFLNSKMQQDIYRLVLENETYITANAISQALRGTTIQLNTRVSFTSACGLYSFFTADEIKDAVTRMTQNEILCSATLKGVYGQFKVLKTNPIHSNALRFLTEPDEKMIRKKKRKGQELTDPEAEYCLKQILNKETLEPADYMDLLLYTELNPAVAAHYIDEIRSKIEIAPDEIKKYIRYKKGIADEITKKFLRYYLKK